MRGEYGACLASSMHNVSCASSSISTIACFGMQSTINETRLTGLMTAASLIAVMMRCPSTAALSPIHSARNSTSISIVRQLGSTSSSTCSSQIGSPKLTWTLPKRSRKAPSERNNPPSDSLRLLAPASSLANVAPSTTFS